MTEPVKPSLSIHLTMNGGLWRYAATDANSILGSGYGFVSPERAFNAALAHLEEGVVNCDGFDPGDVTWVEANPSSKAAEYAPAKPSRAANMSRDRLEAEIARVEARMQEPLPDQERPLLEADLNDLRAELERLNVVSS